MSKDISKGEVWRHKKTDGLYKIIEIGIEEKDLTEAIVYKSLQDGKIWIRNKEEFLDGRFEKVTTV